jgi:hypothetical protein
VPDKGPAEKAGEKIDKAIDKTKDAVKDRRSNEDLRQEGAVDGWRTASTAGSSS